MSKALRTVAVVVGAAALIATGIGAAGGAGLLGAAAAGTAGTIGGVATATFTAVGAIAGAVSAGLTLVAGAIAKTPGVTISGNQTKFTASLDQGVPWVVGITATAGCAVHDICYDASGSKNNAFQTFFGVWSGDRINKLRTLQIDGNTVNLRLDDKNPTIADNVDGAYFHWMFFRSQLGTEKAALQANGLQPYPLGWSATSLLAGMGAFAWTLKFDTSGATYPGGTVPQQRSILEGALAWDPRLDSTYPGGNGPQRQADPSTWAFTENPFLLGLRWALGIYRNGKRVLGIGMALASINVDSAVQAANVADANGWKTGGVVYSTDPKFDVLKKLCAAGSGEPIRVGGMLYFLVDAPRVSLDTITNNDIIGRATVPSGARMKDRMNGCIPTFRSPDHDWQLVPATKVQVADYLTADGRPRTKAITWELVQAAPQVAQLATYAICNSREIDGIVMPLKIRWVGYKPGDAVTIKASVLAMDSQLVVLRRRVLDPATGAVTFTARTETTAKHAFALGQTTTPPPAPALATVNRLGLLIPGINAAWSGMANDNGKLPADYATNSGDPTSPFGNAGVAGPYQPGTVGSYISRIVNVENYLAPTGWVQATFNTLTGQVDAANTAAGQAIDQTNSLATTVGDLGSRFSDEVKLRDNQAGTYAIEIKNFSSMFAGTSGSALLSSITTLQGTVADNQKTISQRVDTLTSSLSSLSSSNLLSNGAFANGLSGWTTFGSNWSVVTDYTPPGPFAQSPNNGYSGMYTTVSSVRPGKNYCFGFESDNDGGDNSVYLCCRWFDSGGNAIRDDNGTLVHPGSGWGNRVNNGPYQAPSNAAYAEMIVFLAGNDTGNRRVTRIQFQQADQPTDYSDTASVQALQAQVSVQAGTLADVSNKVNGTVLPRLSAYWQTQTTVGNSQAFITASADLGNGQTATQVAIGAQAFHVLNDVAGSDGSHNWLKTLDVINGNVHIYGNLAVDGAVSVRNLQYGTGGLYSLWYNENVATQNSTSNWYSFAQMELTPQDGQMVDGFLQFVLSSSGADTDVLFRVRRDDGTIVKGGQSGQGVKIRARAGGSSVSLGWIDSVPAGRDTTWYVEWLKASDGIGVTAESAYGVIEEVGRGYVQHATITTASGMGPGAGSGGGGNINGGAGGGGGGGGFGNSGQRQF